MANKLAFPVSGLGLAPTSAYHGQGSAMNRYPVMVLHIQCLPLVPFTHTLTLEIRARRVFLVPHLSLCPSRSELPEFSFFLRTLKHTIRRLRTQYTHTHTHTHTHKHKHQNAITQVHTHTHTHIHTHTHTHTHTHMFSHTYSHTC
jgi:hypothetical protein